MSQQYFPVVDFSNTYFKLQMLSPYIQNLSSEIPRKMMPAIKLGRLLHILRKLYRFVFYFKISYLAQLSTHLIHSKLQGKTLLKSEKNV